MSLVNRRGVRNPAVRSIVWPRGSTTCLGCGTCLLVTWEANKHEQKAARRQSSTRPDSAFNGSEDSHRGESSAGGDDKRDRLDGAVGVGRALSAEHIEKCRRSPPAITRLGRGDDSQGHARCHLARVGGSHLLLRPCTVSAVGRAQRESGTAPRGAGEYGRARGAALPPPRGGGGAPSCAVVSPPGPRGSSCFSSRPPFTASGLRSLMPSSPISTAKS